MYFPLTTVSMLSILSATATARATPPETTFELTTRSGNSASSPGFMTGTNVTVSAWTRCGCGVNANGAENIFFPNLLYGKDNHALVVSYMLGRDLAANEELDYSFAYANGSSVEGPNGMIDWECALFQQKASPDENGNTLKGQTCYTPDVPVTCFNLWRTS